jgi:hypothetical protein
VVPIEEEEKEEEEECFRLSPTNLYHKDERDQPGNSKPYFSLRLSLSLSLDICTSRRGQGQHYFPN